MHLAMRNKGKIGWNEELVINGRGDAKKKGEIY